MVELNVPEDVCFLIDEAMKLYNKKKGKFDCEDAVNLIVKRKEIF